MTKIDVKDLEYDIALRCPENNDVYIINKITILDKKWTEFLVTVFNENVEEEITDDAYQYVGDTVANERAEFVLTFDTGDLLTAIYNHTETFLSQVTIDIKDIKVSVTEKDPEKRDLYKKYITNDLRDFLECAEFCILVG